MTQQRKVRLNAAIYTRKSSEDGLELDYNSLEAQWDSGRHYINSHAPEGWVHFDKRYEDGGFSGGTIERPGLKSLITDVKNGLVDVIVVYKIDRLTRSLLDFAQLVEIFDKHNVTFVSVTENFNTTTPMGRLTLNMLLSFAQFEREIAGERIRDKFAASKKKGIWMGGTPPLGYDVKDRKLVINQQESKTVRFVFEQFLSHGSVVKIVEQLDERCMRTKSWTTQQGKKRLGDKIDANVVMRILRNPLYKGVISHKGEHFPGEHNAIIAAEQWDAVQAVIEDRNRRKPNSNAPKGAAPYLLRGLLTDADGWAMTPGNGGNKRTRRYRYYVSTKAIKHGYGSTEIKSLPAEQIEELVLAQVKQFLVSPEMVNLVHKKASAKERFISEDAVRKELQQFDSIWGELFPQEQNRVMQLIIQRIQVSLDGLNITFQPNGIMEVYEQITREQRAS